MIPVLCIFARAPVLGQVKSRLAAELGAAAALEAHVALVEDTLDRLASAPGVTAELWLDDDAHPIGREWSRRWRLPLRRQDGNDLGGRMNAALEQSLIQGRACAIVGTDCPDIDADYVQRAVAGLVHHDLVLGPAADGGYGLVEARRRVPEIFRGISWGRASVLQDTLAAAAAAGRSVMRLEEIWDVDTAADWRRYLRSRPRA